MTYFHVRITSKSEPAQPEVELDTSLEELMERFVRPYERGQPIVIAGRTVSSKDIGRIQSNETEQASTQKYCRNRNRGALIASLTSTVDCVQRCLPIMAGTLHPDSSQASLGMRQKQPLTLS